MRLITEASWCINHRVDGGLGLPLSATAVLAAPNDNALGESEARFRELADNISQFAWTADAT